MACLTFSVTFLSTLFSACFLENSAYYLLLSPNSITNSGSTTICSRTLLSSWIFPLLLVLLAPMDQLGPSVCPPHAITQGYRDAPCGSLACPFQGEQLCCEAKAELMINSVHLCYPGSPPWSKKCSHGSSGVGVQVFGHWSHTFPNVWIPVPTFLPCCGTVQKELKGADSVCTLLHARAHTLTSLLIAPEKLDRPSAKRCLV